MIFPIGDDQVQGGAKPIFAYSFIVLNIVIFLFQSTQPNALICEFGAIPNEIIQGQDIFTLFTSMFMHGGWMHLIGNMMFLWVFADNIEATVGNIPFLLFYIMGGLAAHGAHIFFNSGGFVDCCEPCASVNGIKCVGEGMKACLGSIPTVGASGAIAAVLGAYLVMFPYSKIKIWVMMVFSSFTIPAIFFLGFWIVQQLFSGVTSLNPTEGSGGVAWWAHIGGFFFGLAAGYFARQTNEKVKETNEHQKRYRDDEIV